MNMARREKRRLYKCSRMNRLLGVFNPRVVKTLTLPSDTFFFLPFIHSIILQRNKQSKMNRRAFKALSSDFWKKVVKMTIVDILPLHWIFPCLGSEAHVISRRIENGYKNTPKLFNFDSIINQSIKTFRKYSIQRRRWSVNN